MAAREPSFDEYWTRYVRFHADDRVRKLLFASTSVGLGVAAAGVLTRRLGLLAAASAFAFAPSIVARVAWGKSTASLQGSPLFRVAAALRAWRMTVLGTLQGEIDRLTDEAEPAEDFPDGDPLPRPNMVTDHTLH
jgi:hypothetical protein